ncbi:hypothetical protein N7454_007964 [Penicillium verhagenii]|nr:hypothetical protein N7454_007964 [Penicillium verhagenii]
MTDTAAHAAALAGFLKPSTFDWADESEELESPTFSPPLLTEHASLPHESSSWKLKNVYSDEDIEVDLTSVHSYDSDRTSSPTPSPSPPLCLPLPAFLPEISFVSASLWSQNAFNWSDTAENGADKSQGSNNMNCMPSSHMDEATNSFDGYDASQLSTDAQNIQNSSPQHFLESSRSMDEEFEGYEGFDERYDESRLNVDAQSISNSSPRRFLVSSRYMGEEFEGYEGFDESYDESRLNVDAQSISTTSPQHFLESSSHIDEQANIYKSYNENKAANADESYYGSRLNADTQSVQTATRKRLVKSSGYMNLVDNAYESCENDEADDAYENDDEEEVLDAYEIYMDDEGVHGDNNHNHSKLSADKQSVQTTTPEILERAVSRRGISNEVGSFESSKDEHYSDDDADEDTWSLPDSVGSDDNNPVGPIPPSHKSPNYREEVQRYIPVAYDVELRWQDETYNDWLDVHHFNWWGQPVFHPSPSLPEESLAVLHATPKSFDDDNDLAKWVLLKNAQKGLDPVLVDCGDQKAYNDLMALRGSALQHAAKGRVWRAYSEYGSWANDSEEENELNAPDFADITLNLNPGVTVINGFLQHGYLRSRRGYNRRLERERSIKANKADNSRWAAVDESEAAGRILIKRSDWVPAMRSPLQKVETLSPVETPSAIETLSALETKTPIETTSAVEKPGPLDTTSPIETLSPIEAKSPIETPSPTETSSSHKTSSPIETSSSLETSNPIHIEISEGPKISQIALNDAFFSAGQNDCTVEKSFSHDTTPKRALRRTAKQQQLRPTPLPALGQPKKLGKTAGKALAVASTGPVDTSRDPEVYFSFPTPKLKKKNKIKRFFVKTWQVFRDGLSSKA